MQKIHPFLWFNDNAEEAMNYYVSIFKNSEVTSINRYGAGAPQPEGSVMTTSFLLEGQKFVALNGGPHFTFSPAISFVVHCDSQEEVDYYWEKLSAGGEEHQCGWLSDRYGVSWQIVPDVLVDLLCDPDPVKAQKAMAAMMQMKKIDINLLKQAQDA